MNRIRLLALRALTGSTNTNELWDALKPAIRFEFMIYSVGLVASEKKKGE